MVNITIVQNYKEFQITTFFECGGVNEGMNGNISYTLTPESSEKFAKNKHLG